MAEPRGKFDQDLKEGVVQLVRETGTPITQVAGDLGINEGTLGNWVNAYRHRREELGHRLAWLDRFSWQLSSRDGWFEPAIP